MTATEPCPICGALPCDQVNDPHWQPIATAPRTSRAILVWNPENKCVFAVTWSTNEERPGWQIFGGGYRAFLNPSHWMPLPDAPVIS